MGKLKKAADDAKAHNDKSLKLANEVKHVVMNLKRPADDAEVGKVIARIDDLLEHLK
jgi:hypothetical protein